MPSSLHRSAQDAKPLACVLGEVDLVRALALAGIRSVVVAQPGNPARYSRAAVATLDWADPWKQPEELVQRLLDFAGRQRQPPILYYDGDWDLLLVSRYRSQLRPAFRFTVPEAGLVEALVDKARFQSLAERLRLPVPRARWLSHNRKVDDDLELRFPVLAKPLTRQHATWKALTTAKALHVEDPDALRSVQRKLTGADVDVLVQEVIPGPERRIESYHVYIDEAGRTLGEFTGRKLRTYPPEYGYTTALTITDSEEVKALGRAIAGRVGLRGVAKLDFKRGPDGTLHLLEINPRFNLWHHPGALAGVNLPALVYQELTGLDSLTPDSHRPGIRWCSLAHDFQAARIAGMRTRRWLRWVAACEAKSGFAWDDPLPLPRALVWRLGRRLRTRREGM